MPGIPYFARRRSRRALRAARRSGVALAEPCRGEAGARIGRLTRGVTAGPRVTVADVVGDADGRADGLLGLTDGSGPDALGLGPTPATTSAGRAVEPDRVGRGGHQRRADPRADGDDSHDEGDERPTEPSVHE